MNYHLFSIDSLKFFDGLCSVKRGDTLYYIAWITDNEVSDLTRINKIPASYNLYVGQKLRLSSGVTSKTATNRRKNSTSGTLLAKSPPPDASRCWRWPTNGKVVQNYSSADGGNQLLGYGNLIMIKHGENFITAYAHNDTTVVRNGQDVKAGQNIGTMGNSGTHSVFLHFQIRYRATALNPQSYLPPRGSPPSC